MRFRAFILPVAVLTACNAKEPADRLELTVMLDRPPYIVAAKASTSLLPPEAREPGQGRLRWEARDPGGRIIDAAVTGDPRNGSRELRLSLPNRACQILLYDDHGLIGRVAVDPALVPLRP